MHHACVQFHLVFRVLNAKMHRGGYQSICLLLCCLEVFILAKLALFYVHFAYSVRDMLFLLHVGKRYPFSLGMYIRRVNWNSEGVSYSFLNDSLEQNVLECFSACLRIVGFFCIFFSCLGTISVLMLIIIRLHLHMSVFNHKHMCKTVM